MLSTPATAAFDPKEVLRRTEIKPYPYQDAGVRAIIKDFKSGLESVLATFPTGTGKGFIMAWVSKWAIMNGMRSLTLAHTAELVNQNSNYHWELGIPTKIEMADQRALGQDTLASFSSVWAEADELIDPVSVSASKDTLQGKRLQSWPRDYFGLINTDEAHHAVCDTYTNIYRHFKNAKRLFVTATADRADGQDLGSIVQKISYQYPIDEAIKNGWLCRPKFYRLLDVQVDLRKWTRRKMADFCEADIAVAIEPHIGRMANSIKPRIGDRQTIIFCPDILTSGYMADACKSIGLKADMISGKTKNRSEIMNAFKAKEFQVLCNAMVLTEGVDVPNVSAIVLCRPTMSRALYSQMIGRGLRKGKPDCEIYDFTWITSGDSGLPEPDKLFVTPGELFDTYQTPTEVQEIANKMLEEGETDDVMEAVERATKEYEERVRVRIKVREERVRSRVIVYDPFAVMEAFGIPIRQESPSTRMDPPTQSMLDTAKKFKIVGAERMSKRRLKVVLNECFERVRRKPSEPYSCSHPQIAHMVANGVEIKEARAMSKDEASAFLSTLWGKSKVS